MLVSPYFIPYFSCSSCTSNALAETCPPSLLVESKTPATVVLLLNSLEEDILVKACEAIHTFAEKGDESKISLLGLGALEPLCRLITHNNKLVRRNAFMALGIMATNGDVKGTLKKLDAVPSMVEKLSPEEDTVVHEFATLCLASLSTDFVCKAQIFDNKGLLPLIQLLSSPDPDVIKNSLEIIFNLVQDYQCRLAVHKLGGIPPLLKLLMSDFPVIQKLALQTLQNITTDKDTRNTFREEQGFEKLMDILNNMVNVKRDFSDLHDDTLQVVANCLSDSESVQLIHNSGGLTKLMEFLLSPSIPEIQSNTVKCITRVAQSSESREVLHKQDVEKVLVELLSVADIKVKSSTCQAVAAMSLHLASKDSFRDLGVIPAVVQLLSSENLMLRAAATHALSNLTHSNKRNTLAVYEAGGHEFLVQQLNGNCPRTVTNSAATLCNMAGQETIRSSILSHGAMQALVEPLKSTDSQVLINTTLCLSVLARDKEARAELQRAGGLQPLVNLLRSNHKEVLHSACMAVSVCASDEATAVEMCKYGALEFLQEISQSVNRRSRFTKLAMVSLLNSNLSVKYSLTGHLTSSDIITDGFYDAGKVCYLLECTKSKLLHVKAFVSLSLSFSPLRLVQVKGKKKEEDKQKYEMQFESLIEKPSNTIEDVSLQILVEEAKESILRLSDEKEQYAALARLVSDVMGGAVEMEKLHKFSWMLHLSELKFQLQSNVVPIGLIKKGIYCHRALLFKCLADCIGIGCSLVRGEYNRAWNEVLLFNWNASNNQHSSQPRHYIVDLMHKPGSLLEVDTPAAVWYQTI
uniref:Armadillo repeat containing 3 n=1 Tax=Acanthochromis polyacanthus TaxID=80966 RepID=A0A3Q1FKK5_9TELE